MKPNAIFNLRSLTNLIVPMNTGIAYLISTALLFVSAQAISARTINVPDDYETISAGIEAAEDGDEVVLADGTYRGAGNLNIGFVGRAITVRSENGPDNCIIDCERENRGFIFQNGETSSSKLIGITIIRGVARNPAYGGGIYFDEQSSPEIRDCRILNCEAGGWGGGVEIETASNPTFFNTLLAGNSSGNGGGVLVCTGSQPVFTNCTIVNNTGTGVYSRGFGEDGGTQVTLINCVVAGNTAGNLQAGSTIQASWSDIEGGYQGTGNLPFDPLFVDPDVGDFSLRRGSPCINRGDPESPEDPDGTRADMGAFPYNYEGPITLNVPDDYATIQGAIDDAIDSDTVLVEAGGYREYINYHGKDIVVIGNPDRPEVVVIDGGGATSVVTFESDESEAAQLIGFTITNGIGWITDSEWGVGRFGGGIVIVGNRPTISQCIITGNTAFAGGGIWMMNRSTSRIEHTQIINNSATHHAAGIGAYNESDPVISNCEFISNWTPEDNAGAGGGGYWCSESNTTIEYSTFWDNRSGGEGAGIGVTSSVLTVENCTFNANVSNTLGGAIVLWNGSTLTARNSIFASNSPDEIGCQPDHGLNVIQISYSNVEDAQDRINLNGNGELTWQEGNIDADPLFVDPDNGNFHLQVTSSCIDAGDPESDLDPDGTRADMGAYYVHQTFHQVALRPGWNMISTFNQPRIARIQDVWSEIVGRGNLLLTKNQGGQFFNPHIGENGFSNMVPWDVCQGYLAKVAEADTLVVVNVPVDVSTPIPLRQGWNIIAYFPEERLDVRDAFASVQDQLIMVKDMNGRFYRAQIDFSNLLPLERGNGYQVAVSAVCDLVYPAGEMMVMGEPDVEELPSHFVHSEMTGNNMSLLISALIPAEVGIQSSEIGVFTKSGLCVGTVSLSTLISQHSTGLAVWGDDPNTPEIDGAKEGEPLYFRIWDGSTEYSADVKFTEGSDKYTTDGFAQLNIVELVSQPTEWSLSEPYPNPFNPLTTIKFALLEDSKVRLTIYDLSGREVASLLNDELKAGTHSATWNAEGVTSGIYLVKMETPTFSATKKVTLVK